jgi:hypothetical protein
VDRSSRSERYDPRWTPPGHGRQRATAHLPPRQHRRRDRNVPVPSWTHERSRMELGRSRHVSMGCVPIDPGSAPARRRCTRQAVAAVGRLSLQAAGVAGRLPPRLTANIARQCRNGERARRSTASITSKSRRPLRHLSPTRAGRRPRPAPAATSRRVGGHGDQPGDEAVGQRRVLCHDVGPRPEPTPVPLRHLHPSSTGSLRAGYVPAVRTSKPSQRHAE